ncbi:tail-specific protease [Lewinellaceae bacterium SD302]|nr:tail-specific protease [Lewinellaceae bacterium SD302]
MEKQKIMLQRLPLLFSGLLATGFFAFTLFSPQTGGSDEEKEAVIMQTVMRNLERYHFSPAELDDEFSTAAYRAYLDQLDGARLFFCKEDLDKLSGYRNLLDDQAREGKLDFFNAVMAVYDANRIKTQEWYRDILSEPFDLEKGGTFEVREKESEWTPNAVAQRVYWEEYLLRDAIRRVNQKMEEAAKDTTLTEQPTAIELEKEVREDILETFDNYYDRLDKAKRSQRLSSYINALTGMFDPHTNYLRPRDKENFDIRFSGRLEGIGATLQATDEYTKVTSLVVGGPAWKGKEIEEDDMIMAVRQDDQKEAVDIKGMTIDDVVDKIRGPKGTVVHLTVKKPTGEISEISITRDIIVIDDKFARSLILDGKEEGEQIGYIYLPSFYADFQNEDGHFSAEDVKVEIEKLKNVGVDGIILDLRDNGGGSLAEVVKMSGLFIEKGPVVQVKDRRDNLDVLRDTDPEVQYDGPLAIMVNNGSASASEIIAAALQDYDRAVIVGSSSTFGKGTVQRFIDLDRTIRGYEEVKPLGTVKLTIQKFFRVDGGSTQLRGVVPDIVLPDVYAYIESGEKRQENALEWTQIAPVKHEQDAFIIGNIDLLRKRSAERVGNNATFALVEENATRFKRLRDRNTFPLSLEDYQQREQADDEEAKKYKKMFKDEVVGGVANLAVDLPTFEEDESKKDRNDEFIKDVKRDVYINETLYILNDLINMKMGMGMKE